MKRALSYLILLISILASTQVGCFDFDDLSKGLPKYSDERVEREMKNIVYSARGFIQGFKRGFYQANSLVIKPTCFGNQTEEMIYHVYKVFFDKEWENLFIVPGFVYDIYLSAVVDCQVEELVYDLFEFCDKHNCTAMKIIENDIASIF